MLGATRAQKELLVQQTRRGRGQRTHKPPNIAQEERWGAEHAAPGDEIGHPRETERQRTGKQAQGEPGELRREGDVVRIDIRKDHKRVRRPEGRQQFDAHCVRVDEDTRRMEVGRDAVKRFGV